ncbi:DUF2777 family protein [Priestia koreensis]|uniref:DUF2777 domain-containing protein n=1 Tax=Priestia koreensis TaxID=284581 RepID=A0A0M0LGP8_9BACI|nr:DUF2777 family protein [Priestia koreensis]KOO50260.1 hypothetical protein AMD01_00360 [Priestia koreensis]
MKQPKLQILKNQPRSFIYGTLECIDSQWVFFELDSDEAFRLEDVISESFEVEVNGNWEKALWVEENIVQLNGETYFLGDGDEIRVQKQLLKAYELLIEELDEAVLMQFTTQLNALDFSLYDCLYSCNTLYCLPADKNREGVNFLIFDNGDFICSVHHIFARGTVETDRFEFTLNTGKRLMITSLV